MTFNRQLIQLAALFVVGTATAFAVEPLSLDQAMQRALAANPAIQSQHLEVQKQGLETDIAKARHLPKVDLSGDYTRSAHPSLVTPISQAGVFPPLDRDVASVGVSLNLPLYAGGKLVAGESLAEHRREAAVEALRGAGQDLLFNVTATFTKALHLRDLQGSARARIRTLETEEKHIAQRLAQGRVAKLDLIRLQTQLSQARHDLLAITQGERDALSLLATLLAAPGPLPPLADLAPTRVSLPETRDAALDRAMHQRPELRRARSLVKAAADQVDIAKGEQRPQISLIAKAQENAGGDWRGYSDARIGVQVTIPVFDGSIRRNRIAQADLEQRRSALLVEQTRNELTAEVEQSIGAVTEGRARLAVAGQSEREAEEALRIESARYESGESTVTDLLGAETALWAARVNRLQAGYDVTTSQARVLRAIGELTPEGFQPQSGAAALELELRPDGDLADRLDEYVRLHRHGAFDRWRIGDPLQGARQ